MNTPNTSPSLAMPVTPRSRRGRIALVLLALVGAGAVLFLALSHFSGKFTDIAALAPASHHAARTSGPIALGVQEGQHVAKGDPLFSINGAEALTRLAEEEARLAALETLLPVDYVRPASPLPTPSGLDDGNTVAVGDISDARLRALFDAENAARKDSSEASVREARAAVEMRSLAALKARGQRNAAEFEEAQQRYENAKNIASRFRTALEEASTARATVERERARIVAMQNASGVKGLPAGPRIREYEHQLALVLAARERKNAAVVTAPAAGIVSGIAVTHGQQVESGQPVLTFTPVNGYTLVLLSSVARWGAENTLQTGASVRVSIPAIAKAPLEGRIRAISTTPPQMLAEQRNGQPAPSPPLMADDSRSMLGKLLDRVHVVVHVPVHGAHSPLPAGADIRIELE